METISTTNYIRWYRLQPGDILRVEWPLEELQPLIDAKKIKIIEVFYAHKKWWQFWKKKQPIAYKIMGI